MDDGLPWAAAPFCKSPTRAPPPSPTPAQTSSIPGSAGLSLPQVYGVALRGRGFSINQCTIH